MGCHENIMLEIEFQFLGMVYSFCDIVASALIEVSVNLLNYEFIKMRGGIFSPYASIFQ